MYGLLNPFPAKNWTKINDHICGIAKKHLLHLHQQPAADPDGMEQRQQTWDLLQRIELEKKLKELKERKKNE